VEAKWPGIVNIDDLAPVVSTDNDDSPSIDTSLTPALARQIFALAHGLREGPGAE
jgi:hypothetical protein